MPLRGVPIVVTGPSGVGKGTVIAEMMRRDPGVVHSVSMTTRPARPGETEGVSYFFVDRPRFEDAIRRHELVEWAEVYGNYYGTPLAFLEENFNAGRDVVLDIDLQGASAVRAHFEDAILIYLLPPSLESLKERLVNRPRGDGDDIDLRLSEACTEMRMIGMFHYALVNDDVGRAAQAIQHIIHADRHRLQRVYPSLRENSLLGRPKV
ncbi:MAG: guanylate kinase [bacterium]|nr:guanylate kinase [bacterium]